MPPLEVQQEIVAEIEGYQRVIDGARAVVENYRPHIAVDPEWPVVALGDVCNFNEDHSAEASKKTFLLKKVLQYMSRATRSPRDFNSFRYFIDELKYESMKGFTVYPNDLIMSCSGTMGRTAIVPGVHRLAS